MVARHSLLAGPAALAVCLAACGDTRPPLASSAGNGLCVACHGGADNATGAPPVDLAGRTGTAVAGVGAHTAHVAGPLAGPFGCGECHEPVTAVDSPLHRNGVVDLPFGPLSRTGGASPAWNPSPAASPSCSTVYCHGSYPQGGNAATPVWTRVDGTFAACTSCHGAPPSTGHHVFHVVTQRKDCSDCHSGIATGSGIAVPVGNAAIVGPALHVNGVRDVVFAGGGTWTPAPTAADAAAGTCTNVCHGTQSW